MHAHQIFNDSSESFPINNDMDCSYYQSGDCKPEMDIFPLLLGQIKEQQNTTGLSALRC